MPTPRYIFVENYPQFRKRPIHRARRTNRREYFLIPHFPTFFLSPKLFFPLFSSSLYIRIQQSLACSKGVRRLKSEVSLIEVNPRGHCYTRYSVPHKLNRVPCLVRGRGGGGEIRSTDTQVSTILACVTSNPHHGGKKLGGKIFDRFDEINDHRQRITSRPCSLPPRRNTSNEQDYSFAGQLFHSVLNYRIFMTRR